MYYRVNHPFLRLAVGFSAGVGLGVATDIGWQVWCACALIVTWLWWRRAHDDLQKRWRGWLAWICIGAAWSAAHEPTKPLPVGAVGSTPSARIEGVITGPIRRVGDRLAIQLTEATVREGSQTVPISGAIRLSVPDAPSIAVLNRGQRIRTHARVRPVRPIANPGQPPRGAVLLRRGVQASAWVRDAASVHVLSTEDESALDFLDRLRARFRRWCTDELSPQTADRLQAVVLGDGGAVARDERDQWRQAGVAHLLAISGLHVGLIAWLVFGWIRRMLCWIPAWSRRWPSEPVAAVFAVGAAWLYVLIAGSPISASRAAWMITGIVSAHWVGRSPDVISGLSLALVMVLGADPLAITDPSFQLSFSAVSALMLCMSPIDRAAQWVRDNAPFVGIGRLVSYLMRMMGASAVCTLATLPFVLWHFRSVPLAGIWANVVAIPLFSLGVVVPGLTAFGGVSLDWTGLAGLLIHWLEWGGALCHQFVDWVAAQGGQVDATPWSESTFILVGLAVVAGVFVIRRVRWGRLRWAVIGGLAGLVSLAILLDSSPPGELQLTFLAVGHGDAIVVQTPHGRTLLVDAGGDPTGRRDVGADVVVPALRALGVDRIDIAVITHAHPDHFAGFAAVSARIPIGELWVSQRPNQPGTYGQLIDDMKRRGTIVRGPEMLGGDIRLDGIHVRVLHPSPGADSGERIPPSYVNDNSLVLHVAYGGFSALLSGDIEGKGEAALLRRGALLASTVLKVPHHGSKTSSSQAFLQAVQPLVAIAQADEGGRFRFPHAEVSARYDTFGIPLLVTGHMGALQVRSDGTTWNVTSF